MLTNSCDSEQSRWNICFFSSRS